MNTAWLQNGMKQKNGSASFAHDFAKNIYFVMECMDNYFQSFGTEAA